MSLAPLQALVVNAPPAAPAGTPPSPTSSTTPTKKRARYHFPLYVKAIGLNGNANLTMQIFPGMLSNPQIETLFDNERDPAVIAAQLTPTEYALMGELLARGGADYGSNWTFGNGKFTRYARRPPFVRDFYKHYQYTGQSSYKNPVAERLLQRRCKFVVAFRDLDKATAVWQAATDMLKQTMLDARQNPRALQPKKPAK
jgi:hypothetical protein